MWLEDFGVESLLHFAHFKDCACCFAADMAAVFHLGLDLNPKP